MRVGELRHRVSIQNRTEVSDGHDGVNENWAVVRARLAANVTQLWGKDLQFAKQIDPRISHNVVMRFYRDYQADLDGGRARLLFHDGDQGDRVLDIVTPPIETEPRIALMFQCREAA